MLLLAISAYKKTGKDTVKEYIRSKIPYVLTTKFAEPVKQSLSIIYGVSRDYWEYDKETPQTELYGKTKREVMQTYGDGIRQLLGNDIWINNLDKWLLEANSSIFSNKLVIVVDDLRYKNEIDYIQNNKGKVIYIDKDIEFSDKHISESYYPYIKQQADYVLDNNKDLNHLFKQVDPVLQELKLL